MYLFQKSVIILLFQKLGTHLDEGFLYRSGTFKITQIKTDQHPQQKHPVRTRSFEQIRGSADTARNVHRKLYTHGQSGNFSSRLDLGVGGVHCSANTGIVQNMC